MAISDENDICNFTNPNIIKKIKDENFQTVCFLYQNMKKLRNPPDNDL